MLYSGVLRLGPVPALVDDTPETLALIEEEKKKEGKTAAGTRPTTWTCVACKQHILSPHCHSASHSLRGV